MKFDLRQISGFSQRLSPRERTILGAGTAAMVIIGLYSFVWEPLAEGRLRLAQRIVAKQRQLEEIQTMRETYMGLLRQLEASQQVLDRADAKFSLFPHIEATVAQVVGRDKIKSMNPENKVIGGAYREDSVELKLAGISLEQLVDMMYRIEKGDHPLRITRLQVKKQFRDPHILDVTATVSMLKPVEGS
jgi:general secretion pathway protein M